MRKPYIYRKEKTLLMLNSLFGLQICLGAVLIIWRVWGERSGGLFSMQDFLLVGVLMVMLVVFYISLRAGHSIRREDERDRTQQEMIKNMEFLNRSMRAQRHDFLNHMQVIYMLIELNDIKSAAEYLNKVYGDLGEVSRFIKTQDVAINALIQAKYNDALRKGIEFELNISSALCDFPVPSWEMCRILGNLLDNALYEAENSTGVKKMSLSISEGLTVFVFTVTNSGQAILKENLSKIFNPLFTTKSGKGEGMGLAIVKELCERHNAKLSLSSDDAKTVFTVTVPKKLSFQTT